MSSSSDCERICSYYRLLLLAAGRAVSVSVSEECTHKKAYSFVFCSLCVLGPNCAWSSRPSPQLALLQNRPQIRDSRKITSDFCAWKIKPDAKSSHNATINKHKTQRKFLGSWNMWTSSPIHLRILPSIFHPNSSIELRPSHSGGGATRAAPPIGTSHRSVFLKGGDDCLHSNVAIVSSSSVSVTRVNDSQSFQTQPFSWSNLKWERAELTWAGQNSWRKREREDLGRSKLKAKQKLEQDGIWLAACVFADSNMIL